MFGLAACQKSERPLTTEERLKAVQVKQDTTTDFYVPRKSVDYMADLKSLRDSPRQDKDKEKAAAETPTPVQPAAAARPAVATPAPTPVPAPAQPQPAPTRPAETAPAPAPAATAPATTPPPAQAAAPARPAAVGDSAITVVNREQPNFPREAIRQGVESGSVRARLSINAAGDVTSVSIIQSRPARVFDREVQSALSRWKFNPGADNRSFETEISFQR